MIGFTLDRVSVREDVQSVELCLSITVPSDPSLVPFDFFLNVLTQPGTAGGQMNEFHDQA